MRAIMLSLTLLMSSSCVQSQAGHPVNTNTASSSEPPPDIASQRLVQKLEGTIWIDRRAHQVVRLEAHLSGTARIAGGLLGSVAQGSAAIFEQFLVNNEVWLPAYLEEHLSGRVLLFSSYRRDFVIHYRDYEKFRVEVHNEIAAPKPN